MEISKINLLQYKNKIRIKKIEGIKKVYCLIRNKWLVLQPEELVRQLFLLFLVEQMNYPKGVIAVEKEIKVLSRKRRFDILIYNKQLEPFMIVELKAPQVAIDHHIMEQISAYNQSFKSKYLAVTNGVDSFVFNMNYEQFTFTPIPNFPHFS